MGRQRTWTIEQLEEAVEESETMAGVMRKLGLASNGGNSYVIVKKCIKQHGFSTEHFLGQGWASGKSAYSDSRIRAKANTIFCKDSEASSGYVRSIVIKEDLIPYKCSGCGNRGKWMKNSLTLHLDHINGDSRDHRLENLRFLCPNCHSQTETYCGKNVNNGKEKKVSDDDLASALETESSIRQALLSVGLSGGWNYNRAYKIMAKRGIKVKRKEITQNHCVDCGKEISANATRCPSCAQVARTDYWKKIDWPSCEELKKMLSESNYSALGRKLGVSDNAIRKHLESHCD